MRNSDKPTPQNTDEYIEQQAEVFQKHLRELRALVHAIIPDVEEKISYQIPCFKYIYMLVGMGATKDFCSFYVMSPKLMKKMKEELQGLDYKGSTIHFKAEDTLPTELLERIIRERMFENEMLSLKPKKSKS